MFNLLTIYFFIAFLVVLGLMIYYLVYTAKINKRIRSGDASGKKLVDIPRIIMIVVIAVLVFYYILLLHSSNTADEASRNDYAIISVEGQNEYEYYAYGGNPGLTDASFAGIYSKESNPGYNKEVVKKGDYIFTIFKRKSSPDNFHPDFLCYAEYKGEKKDMVVYNTSSFVSASDADDHLDSGFGGNSVSDCLLFIGNLNPGYDFHIRFDLMDEKSETAYMDAMEKATEEDKGNFPDIENFATSSAEVAIRFE